MGISLSLAELKEYFKIWHENNFDNLHGDKIITYINRYLSNSNIPGGDAVEEIKTSAINIGKFLSQVINGQSNLTNSSSLTDVISELANKNINLATINLKKLADDIAQNTSNINTLSTDKADKDWVTGLINGIPPSAPVSVGIETKDIQSGSNLNSYTTVGLYKSSTAATTNTLSNKPSGASGSAFSLVVLSHANNSVRQLLLTAENTANGNRIYTRNYLNSTGSWSNWYELYGEHNLSQLQMRVEWSQGGETTYTLLQR